MTRAAPERIDCVVVGAGVVGLAVARALALAGREVVVLEAATAWGTGVSSRSSEVIHAGLYYPTGSRKARLCVRGRELLHAFCESHGVPHRRCGKLLVATTDAERGALDAIARCAAANGVGDLVALDGAQARALEPALHCVAALLSPSTGIVDSHCLMGALLGDAERAGAALALASPFEAARPLAEGWLVRTGGTMPTEVEAGWLINCAGLDAQAVARRMTAFPSAHIPARRLARGHYFGLSGRSPFSRLIYPMPGDGGLGVHLTLDLGGQARFGPDVEWLADDGSGAAASEGDTPDAMPFDASGASLDYSVDSGRAAAFAAEIRRYWPTLDDATLQPAYAGIRPKLSGPGEPAADFRIDGPAEHGQARVVQLFGIESPGITASMAIGEVVAGIVGAASEISSP